MTAFDIDSTLRFAFHTSPLRSLLASHVTNQNVFNIPTPPLPIGVAAAMPPPVPSQPPPSCLAELTATRRSIEAELVNKLNKLTYHLDQCTVMHARQTQRWDGGERALIAELCHAVHGHFLYGAEKADMVLLLSRMLKLVLDASGIDVGRRWPWEVLQHSYESGRESSRYKCFLLCSLK